MEVSAEIFAGSDEFFIRGIYLDSVFWPDYSEIIPEGMGGDANVVLEVPANYSGGGTKKVFLIFWVEAVEP